ncbi:hypothetical protein [Bradyrhizobium ivorense]|uniref:hypothetical protein n=1 Tax=Bradyrhizobium ivorense TaxID=2511166 RepID=UPI00111601C0|nr:hypothetical protein [Bradyrhizobium ivorense]
MSFARTVSSRVVGLTDQLLGEAGIDAEGVNSIPPPDGALPRLARSAAEARAALEGAMIALDRIQSQIP